MRPENEVPPLFGYLLFLIKELLRIPFDVVRRTRSRSYLLSCLVRAPKDVLWSVVSANKIKLESSPPIEMDTDPDPARPGVFKGFCRVGERSFAFCYQVLEERPDEAIVIRLLPEECDPIYRFGDDYIGAVAITGDDRQSAITSSCELTHTRFATRLTLPLMLLRSMLAMKKTAEKLAGNAEPERSEQIKNAVITGILTFGSFFALFGWSTAVILLGVILIHEFGHVLAMRWAGVPVRGIYFVPFFGGAAVGEGIATSEAARGFIALMGPAFSMLTTLLFALLSAGNPDRFLADLALTSALINGFNLLPMLPLDGGQIMQSLLSQATARSARLIEIAALLFGVAVALVLGDYILLALIVLIAPAVLGQREKRTFALKPLSPKETAWLASGYVASMAFYVAMATKLWGTPAATG